MSHTLLNFLPFTILLTFLLAPASAHPLSLHPNEHSLNKRYYYYTCYGPHCGGIPVGAIVGIVLGGLVAIGALIVAIRLYMQRTTTKRNNALFSGYNQTSETGMNSTRQSSWIGNWRGAKTQTGAVHAEWATPAPYSGTGGVGNGVN